MIRINNIKIEVTNDNVENIKLSIAKKLKTSVNKIIDYKIIKKSIDARDKNNIYYIYKLDINVENEKSIIKNNKDVDLSIVSEYTIPITGTKSHKTRPIIVGSGPAGLFCAYILSEAGYNPLIIERGEKIEDRVKSVENFWETGILNCESNVQFGEGGAGTFSDGKLNTLINDKNNRMKKVFDIFVNCGANEDILYNYKPHIGTDMLREIIKNIRNKIIDMGGEILYKSCLTNLIIKDNKIEKIEINKHTYIDCDILVLAVGHSARDTFEMLINNNLEIIPKAFAIGLRVQHRQSNINESQYGKKYMNILPPATYKLTYQTKNNRGVYSFCMCPGGYVVNASSEENRLVINGMSNNKRESDNSNSAIVVTISPNDFGKNPLDGINYQRNLEETAYKLGHGKIPIQLLKDYKNNVSSSKFGKVKPIFKGKYCFSNLNNLFDSYINSSIIEAFDYFGKKIKWFDDDDVILAGVESRTSSPITIKRNEFGISNISGIYPCGEGAGYAGGITSSSMDGIKIAEEIIKKYEKIVK